MKFADIENIWSADIELLSNVDRGRIFYERAKQVIGEALVNPKERIAAVKGKRIRRTYIVQKIGCTASVLTQNLKIKVLLADADRCVQSQANGTASVTLAKPDEHSAELAELRTAVALLRGRIDEQAKLIVELRRKLRRS